MGWGSNLKIKVVGKREGLERKEKSWAGKEKAERKGIILKEAIGKKKERGGKEKKWGREKTQTWKTKRRFSQSKP